MFIDSAKTIIHGAMLYSMSAVVTCGIGYFVYTKAIVPGLDVAHQISAVLH